MVVREGGINKGLRNKYYTRVRVREMGITENRFAIPNERAWGIYTYLPNPRDSYQVWDSSQSAGFLPRLGFVPNTGILTKRGIRTKLGIRPNHWDSYQARDSYQAWDSSQSAGFLPSVGFVPIRRILNKREIRMPQQQVGSEACVVELLYDIYDLV
jgi:hypothetical protein